MRVLYVGYRTGPSPFLPAMTKRLAADTVRGVMTPKEAAREQARLEAAVAATLAGQPYAATVVEAQFAAYANPPDVQAFRPIDRRPDGSRPPVAIEAARWLIARLPKPDDKSKLVLAGFDTLRLLHLLATECAWAVNFADGVVFPRELWEGGLHLVECFDMTRVLQPEIAIHAPPLAEAAAALGIPGWPGPGVDADFDARLALELAARFGLVPRPDEIDVPVSPG